MYLTSFKMDLETEIWVEFSVLMHVKKRLYLAYFLPHLTYCSTVWLQCGKRNADVIENLNQSILCFVFNDFNNSYEKLLQEINQASLRARRINDMLILVFLALNNAAPSYISDLFTERQTSIYSCEANAD